MSKINKLLEGKSILSIDAETLGLWGKPFSIAAISFDLEGNEIGRFEIRRELTEVETEFAAFGLFNCCRHIEHVADSYEDMLKKFADFWIGKKDTHIALWHMGHVVEAFLFRELRRLGFIGDWDAPYCPIEVSGLLLDNGHEPSSVDSFNKGNERAKSFIEKMDCKATTHHPTYDCIAAMATFIGLNQ